MLHIRRFAWFTFMLLCACMLHVPSASAANSPATSGKRLALVIGNDAYQNVNKLEKAGNDASAMARELRAAGFEVTLERDLNFRSMVRKIEFFTSHVSGGDQVVVFYAGHGVQLRTGSYLLPVDIEANSESEVEKTSYALNDLMDKLSEAKAGFSLVMVDACRDNPLKSSGRSLGSTRGLLPPDPPKGQMVVYSASKGQQALDKLNPKDSNPNGVFTREFIARMKKPGVRIEDLVREVQDSVEDLAKTVGHDQRPAMYNESRGNFYFFGPTTVQIDSSQAGFSNYMPPAKNFDQIEDEAWDSVKDSGDVASLEEFQRQYAKGRHAGQVRIALTKAKSDTKRATALPSMFATTPQVAPAIAASMDDETALWQAVDASKNVDDYKLYLQQFPKGKFSILAKQRLQRLAEETRVKEQGDLLLAWQAAEAAQTLDGYQAFDERYPSSQYRALSQVRVRKLKADQARQQDVSSWNLAQKGSRGDVEGYLARYPGGVFEFEANQLLVKLKKEEAEMPPGKVIKDCPDCPEVVILPAGSFMMGGSSVDEKPSHIVTIKAFAMGKAAVTQGEWTSLMGGNPSNFKQCGTSCPVENVSWADAQEFIQRLNSRTGKSYSLPSESQWEYACRAGGTHEYCGGDNPNTVAWYASNSGGTTHPVAGKQPNAFGLYDMSGNVWQWVQDRYHSNYSGAPVDGSAWVSDGAQQFRVYRGGAWDFIPMGLRSALRKGDSADYRDNYGGFRVARSLARP